VKDKWEECGAYVQAKLIAYDQTCDYDESERDAQLAGARTPFSAGGPPAPSKSTSKRPSPKKGRASRK
jgi:hypothetical protein